MWTDTHTHLDKLKQDVPSILKQAQDNSVCRMITIGTEYKDWPSVLNLTKHEPVYGTLGMHPHEAQHFNDSCEKFLQENLHHDKLVAVGEIGLDYYYEHSDKKVQKEVFHRQLCLAEKFQLPVQIHTREAEEDTLAFLREFQGRVRGILHCFTSSYSMARKALDYGYNISFSGIVTFKNSSDLRETCKKIPVDRMHIETDSPYLAPIPYRGKENQPAWLLPIAEKVCELHQMEKQELSHQLEQNTKDMFGRIQTKEAR